MLLIFFILLTHPFIMLKNHNPLPHFFRPDQSYNLRPVSNPNPNTKANPNDSPNLSLKAADWLITWLIWLIKNDFSVETRLQDFVAFYTMGIHDDKLHISFYILWVFFNMYC